MGADYLPAGPACLLRVAGVPAAALAELGNPDLFDRLRAHLDAEDAYRRFAGDLARRLGDELIPHLPPPSRGLAITTARTLRRGAPADGRACRALAVLAAALDAGPALADDLLAAAERATALAAADAQLTADTAAESERLAGLPWRIATASAELTRVLAETVPEVVAEICERLAAGEDWAGKRLRQRGDYLLRLLARAAFKPTPRGWLGHVALVELGAGPGEPRVGAHAVHRVANIQDGRRALAAGDLPDAWLSLTGLHWVRGDRLCCWVDDPGGLRFVRIKRTPAVDAVRRVLGHNALRTPTVLDLLAPDPDRRAVVRAFLQHLLRLGVLQASAPPAARLASWSQRPRPDDGPGFADVYQRAGGHRPVADAARLAGWSQGPRPDDGPGFADVYQRADGHRPVADAARLAGWSQGPRPDDGPGFADVYQRADGHRPVADAARLAGWSQRSRPDGGPGFADVYRRAGGHLPVADAARLAGRSQRPQPDDGPGFADVHRRASGHFPVADAARLAGWSQRSRPDGEPGFADVCRRAGGHLPVADAARLAGRSQGPRPDGEPGFADVCRRAGGHLPVADAARLAGRSQGPRPDGGPGFTDVYRRVSGHFPVADAARLGELVAQARRLRAVLPSSAARHPVLALVDSRPRPVTQIVAEFLDREPPQRPVRRANAWPIPQPGTPYAALCDWLRAQPGDEVDIDAATLDRVGAPPAAEPAWPVDCLVRPMADGRAVLEAVIPAGVVDARFAEALARLHGRVPQVEGYRAFLDHAAARCGAEPVEILIPPQGERAANTVRRPRYPGTWTGDADPSAYLAEPMSRYLPLRDITVRACGGRVVAEDPAGRVLWPLYHATRVAPPPWDVVLALLTAANPVAELVAPFAVGDPAAAFPGRTRLPRISVGGGLILAGRSALVPRDRLPDPGAPLPARVRALARLRGWAGAPRWNFARAAGGRRPLPVDLDSVGALRVLDRLLARSGAGELVLEEMLPDPDHVVVRDDRGAGLAAQLVLRLPVQADPARLAERAARALRRAEPLVVAS